MVAVNKMQKIEKATPSDRQNSQGQGERPQEKRAYTNWGELLIKNWQAMANDWM